MTRSYGYASTDTLLWWVRNTLLRGRDNGDLLGRLDYALDLLDELLYRFPDGEDHVDAHNRAVLAGSYQTGEGFAPTRIFIPDGPEDDRDEPDDGTYGGSYCKHGTYVGTPGGADFLCGACEGE